MSWGPIELYDCATVGVSAPSAATNSISLTAWLPVRLCPGVTYWRKSWASFAQVRNVK
jgi:hypothetical protein